MVGIFKGPLHAADPILLVSPQPLCSCPFIYLFCLCSHFFFHLPFLLQGGPNTLVSPPVPQPSPKLRQTKASLLHIHFCPEGRKRGQTPQRCGVETASIPGHSCDFSLQMWTVVERTKKHFPKPCRQDGLGSHSSLHLEMSQRFLLTLTPLPKSKPYFVLTLLFTML